MQPTGGRKWTSLQSKAEHAWWGTIPVESLISESVMPEQSTNTFFQPKYVIIKPQIEAENNLPRIILL